MLSLLQLPGKKDLFIEADLMSPLDRIANVSILKVPALFSGSPVLFPLEACCCCCCVDDEHNRFLKNDALDRVETSQLTWAGRQG